MPNSPTPNVVLFGASGCGKSSIINMLFGSDVAETSASATGCTFESHCYKIPVFDQIFNIHDTVGLGEGDDGTVSNPEAIVGLYELLQGLQDGVSLLVFCMRAPRIPGSVHKDLALFNDVICDEKVPTVIVVTGLENEADEDGGLDSWWTQNKEHFDNLGISKIAKGHACITSIRGRRDSFKKEYDESKSKVMTLIKDNSLATPYKVPITEWFQRSLNRFWHWLRSWWPFKHGTNIIDACIERLVEECKMSKEEATVLAMTMHG